MQKKIYQGTLSIVLCAMIILGTIFSYMGYQLYKKECEDELKSIANIILSYETSPQYINDKLKSAIDYDIRITFIDFNGKVIYDSITDTSTLENHSDREEIISANNTGYGEINRHSETLGENTYYYAIKLDNGIIRFSRSMKGILLVFLNIIPIIVLIIGVMFIVVTIFSMNLSEKIMQPIKELISQFDIFSNRNDEKFPEKIATEYSELEPIAETVQILIKRTEKYIENIREQKDRIRIITDNMVEGMIILDEKNDILSVNKSAINILNPDFKVRENRMFLELTRNKTLIDAIDNVKKEKNITTIVDINNNHYRAYINRVENINGTIILLVDVTETVKAEEIRRDFSANVSHELKTPLTTIKGFGELFENGLLTNVDDIKKYGGMIERESERLLFLINDIIRLSEIEEKTEKILSPINLYERAKYSIDLLNQKASTKDITINLVGNDTIINGHEGYINELFINLIDNSIKYNNDGGSITVKISKNIDSAIISVADTGIGISPQDCERIFERFYRVDKSHSRKIGGTGLGLSIVKHIVAYHNGEISINSELGKGTTISIKLPINPNSVKS